MSRGINHLRADKNYCRHFTAISVVLLVKIDDLTLIVNRHKVQ